MCTCAAISSIWQVALRHACVTQYPHATSSDTAAHSTLRSRTPCHPLEYQLPPSRPYLGPLNPVPCPLWYDPPDPLPFTPQKPPSRHTCITTLRTTLPAPPSAYCPWFAKATRASHIPTQPILRGNRDSRTSPSLPHLLSVLVPLRAHECVKQLQLGPQGCLLFVPRGCQGPLQAGRNVRVSLLVGQSHVGGAGLEEPVEKGAKGTVSPQQYSCRSSSEQSQALSGGVRGEHGGGSGRRGGQERGSPGVWVRDALLVGPASCRWRPSGRTCGEVAELGVRRSREGLLLAVLDH